MKNENPTITSSPSALKAFFLASRPRTWPASICPVLIGGFRVETLLFALLIQIGTNFANDYFDFIKGADTEERIGPKRATQQGWVTPSQMLKMTLVTFAAALLVAIPLMLQAGLWSLATALLCVACGVLYTGGPKPLGYLGLGEVFVFIFFGPLAVSGAEYIKTGTISSLYLGVPVGLLSCSLLVANNLRDEVTDRKAGKMTLIARFGHKFGLVEYALCFIPALFHQPLVLCAAPLLFKLDKLKFSALVLVLYTLLCLK